LQNGNFINEKLIGKIIKVGGWIRTTRTLQKGELLFLEVNDGSCVKHLQVIVSNNIINFDELKNDGVGACVIIKGVLEKSQGTKQQVRIR
jgi:asparaginyl-tRNA synthetase